MSHNWIAYCAVCSKRELKRNLDRLKVCAGSYGLPITLAYVHRECLPAVAEFLDVEIPEYDVPHYRTRYSGISQTSPAEEEE